MWVTLDNGNRINLDNVFAVYVPTGVLGPISVEAIGAGRTLTLSEGFDTVADAIAFIDGLFSTEA